MSLIFSEILHVLLINANESVCGNRFIFPQSVNINENVKKHGFHMLPGIRFFVFYLNQENKTKKSKSKIWRTRVQYRSY